MYDWLSRSRVVHLTVHEVVLGDMCCAWEVTFNFAHVTASVACLAMFTIASLMQLLRTLLSHKSLFRHTVTAPGKECPRASRYCREAAVMMRGLCRAAGSCPRDAHGHPSNFDGVPESVPETKWVKLVKESMAQQ